MTGTTSSRPDAGWIARYFIDPPDPASLTAARVKMACGGAGVVLGLLMLVAGSGGTAFLGFVLVAAGGVIGVKGWSAKQVYDAAYARAIPRPSDQDIDQIIGMDTLSIVNRSLPQLGLTADDLVEPRGVTRASGARFDDLLSKTGPKDDRPGANQLVVRGPALPCHLAIGLDSKLRYSKYAFMVICPTNYHLAVYRCELDLCTGALGFERTLNTTTRTWWPYRPRPCRSTTVGGYRSTSGRRRATPPGVWTPS